MGLFWFAIFIWGAWQWLDGFESKAERMEKLEREYRLDDFLKNHS